MVRKSSLTQLPDPPEKWKRKNPPHICVSVFVTGGKAERTPSKPEEQLGKDLREKYLHGEHVNNTTVAQLEKAHRHPIEAHRLHFNELLAYCQM